MSVLLAMKDIDFLPADYRQRTARQRGGVWRLVVAIMLLAVVVGIDAWQRVARHAAEAELAELQQPLLEAQQLKTRLATLQQQLMLAEEEARLMALLDHRWPTTQLLAVPATSAGESIELVSVQLQRRAPESPARRGTVSGDVALTSTEQAAVSPHKQLLTELHGLSGTEWLIVTGTTADPQHAHVYVTQLNQSPLVHSAKLQSVSREGASRIPTAGSAKSRFVVHVTIINSLATANQSGAEFSQTDAQPGATP